MFGCGVVIRSTRALVLGLLLLLLASRTLLGRAASDIPSQAPRDAVMATQAEIQEMQDWASEAFGGQRPPGPGPAVHVEPRLPVIVTAPPFLFRYGGTASAAFLKDWRREADIKKAPDRTVLEVSWTDPKTKLRVTATVTAFERYPAVEWVLEFENQGTEDTPLLEDVLALDAQLRTGSPRKPVRLHHLVGDVCSERSFLPLETEVKPGKSLALAPEGGRSSNGAFPFFNIQYGNQGMITAIGWSGQWRAAIERAEAGPTTVRAGMEKLSLRLHPGEMIRTPRILIMPWNGDLMVAHNRFRRLMLFEYVPREHGRPLRLPVALQCFDRYVNVRPDWGTEATQLRVVRTAYNVGCNAYWLDAAWFQGGFPNGAGNWFCATQGFPNGLMPLSKACHQLGLEFILWFEPERVAAGTQIAREHPEFVFGGRKGGLFKLSDPAARHWLADLLSSRLTEFGADTYRNDFNIDPLGYWRQADAPDRQGLTEIRYVEGQYALWDELLARHPGLGIDNCASGGRRIDLETCHRSVPLWHSDTGCSSGHADWNQTHLYGLSLYVPLFGACAWTPTAYDLRSAATAGIICQFPVLDEKFSFAAARDALAEVKDDQKYWYGDFYPLTQCDPGPGALIAWQLHRSDLNAGIVLAFRHRDCPYPALQTGLHGINPEASYIVEFFDESHAKRERVMPGQQLKNNLELRMSRRGTSLLVRYRRY